MSSIEIDNLEFKEINIEQLFGLESKIKESELNIINIKDSCQVNVLGIIFINRLIFQLKKNKIKFVIKPNQVLMNIINIYLPELKVYVEKG